MGKQGWGLLKGREIAGGGGCILKIRANKQIIKCHLNFKGLKGHTKIYFRPHHSLFLPALSSTSFTLLPPLYLSPCTSSYHPQPLRLFSPPLPRPPPLLSKFSSCPKTFPFLFLVRLISTMHKSDLSSLYLSLHVPYPPLPYPPYPYPSTPSSLPQKDTRDGGGD